ncbi:Protein of unknown function [Pyronema omphalodes CBS 100304]|uniref:Uncharacterized protein n=1 Tax=Pyronema omphalodes (strain CBS 100304) TaxID=1076935 RepID=U4LVV6_PYROM|nr:Protein of unknown function [Pyronema omphalodes CBS 100304]
MKSIKDRISET